MGELVTDEMLDVFALRATLDDLPTRLAERFGGIADRVMFNIERGDIDRDRWRALLDAMRAAGVALPAIGPTRRSLLSTRSGSPGPRTRRTPWPKSCARAAPTRLRHFPPWCSG